MRPDFANDLFLHGCEHAQSAVRDIQRQYEAGRIGYLPVLDAQRTLTQVEQSVAAEESSVATDQVHLFLALGGGWEDGKTAPSDDEKSQGQSPRP